ncbi:Ff.00g038550.m01.CDS01 [Fusarium sp. VM40]|nr:Ff.00g038550.m01.CDS01 [Fusarium sp. VM40]
MSVTEKSYTDQKVILDPKNYDIAWIALHHIEAKAALHLLDERHCGRFAVSAGDNYVYQAGSMGGHNIIIATLPAGEDYGTGSAAALASQVKKFFPNLWFGLLVGVAVGLPDLPRKRDIRLGDVLVSLPQGDSPALIPYDLGKETQDGFQPLRLGYSLAMTPTIVRSAIGSIKLEAPYEIDIFQQHFKKMANCEHATGTFVDPGQENDVLCDEDDQPIQRPQRSQRTRVWYGPIGSGEKLLENAKRRDELRDRYGIIGLETGAAGTMNRIPVGVIRGVCDYGGRQKNEEWQPYAAAMAASYARSLLDEIPPQNKGRASVFSSTSTSLSELAANRHKVDTGE